jgi:3-phenylpropionate/trans-cinnamate dioxygenase ferredoxin reductase component
MIEPVTIVGNGVSGWACARRLAEGGAPVRLIGPGLPYDRPPLSKRALSAGRVTYLTDPRSMRQAGIEHVDGRVVAMSMPARVLTVELADRGPIALTAERLVWATGLAIARPPVPGIELAACNATAGGLDDLVDRLGAPGRRVVVIGGGLIGCETAATLASTYRVTLLERGSRPLQRMHPRVAAAASSALEQAGVRVLAGCEVTEVTPDEVHTATHGTIPADVTVAATGVAPTVPAELGGGRTMRTDEHLRVIGADRVWACGDVAEFPHPRFGPLSIPHWDNARASGAHVAEELLGAGSDYRRDPYWFSDIGRLRIQQVGCAEVVCEWETRDGLHVGRDAHGTPACVLLVNAAARLRDARSLVAA